METLQEKKESVEITLANRKANLAKAKAENDYEYAEWLEDSIVDLQSFIHDLDRQINEGLS